MNVSVVVPVYNEEDTVAAELEKLFEVAAVRQVVVVDDASRDRSVEVVRSVVPPEDVDLELVRQPENRGKGAAVRRGLERTTGAVVGIHDADGEYDTTDIPAVLRPIEEGRTSVVYGSRVLRDNPSYSLTYYWGNWCITQLANLLYGLDLTDLETCYKFFRRNVLDSFELYSDGFTIEPELTAKLARSGYVIEEVPIHYHPRTREAGKKITAWDGVEAAAALLYYRFI